MYASVFVAISSYSFADAAYRLAYRGEGWREYVEWLPMKVSSTIFRTAPVTIAASYFIGMMFMRFRKRKTIESVALQDENVSE